jgi:hypothetical protein
VLGVGQAVECLYSKCRALSSKPSTTRKKKSSKEEIKRQNNEVQEWMLVSKKNYSWYLPKECENLNLHKGVYKNLYSYLSKPGSNQQSFSR